MMNNWDGDFVVDNLNLLLPDDDYVKFMMGFALRNNKKRAHLIVSRVLGKHIPQQPKIINRAAYLLADQINNVLHNKHNNSENNHLSKQLYKEYKNNIIPAVNDHFNNNDVTVFAYAETATNLGALIAEHLGADYVHSTRYDNGYKSFGDFEEEHSHAASHKILLKDESLLINPNNHIVLIDDELTTGNTVMNTIKAFEEKIHRDEYIVAVLTDLRDKKDLISIKQFEKDNNLTIHFVSLLQLHLNIPVNSLEVGQKLISVIKENNNVNKTFNKNNNTVHTFNLYNSNWESLSRGVSNKELYDVDRYAKNAFATVYSSLNDKDNILVLGLEEEMYLPFKFAQVLEDNDYNVHYSTTTLSPVVEYNNSNYAIKNKIEFMIDGDNSYKYCYNIKDDSFNKIFLFLKNNDELNKYEDFLKQLSNICNVYIFVINDESKGK